MEVVKDVHLLDSTKGSHAYLVVGQETVLVDTGRRGLHRKILQEIRDLGYRPNEIKHILLTHHDLDHIGNAKALKESTGAKLWTSQKDLPYIYEDITRPGIKRVFQSILKVDIPKIDSTYEEQQISRNFRVIYTPGHTPGHVCFLVNSVLFAGDLVTCMGGKLKPSPSIMTWNQTSLTKSILDIGQLEFEWICPAHGIPIKRPVKWI